MIRLSIPNMKSSWRTMPQVGSGTQEEPLYWNFFSSTTEGYLYTSLPSAGGSGGVNIWVYGKFEEGEEYDFRFNNMMEMDLQVKVYTMDDELLATGDFDRNNNVFELTFEPETTDLYKLHIQTYDSYGTPEVGVSPVIPAVTPYIERVQGLAWTIGYDERNRLEKFNTMPELPALPPYGWDWTNEWGWHYWEQDDGSYYTGLFELDYKRYGHDIIIVKDRSVLGKGAEYTLQQADPSMDKPSIKYGGLYLESSNNGFSNWYEREVGTYNIDRDESLFLSFEIYIDKLGHYDYYVIVAHAPSWSVIVLDKSRGIKVGYNHTVPFNGPLEEGVTYSGYISIGAENPEKNNKRRLSMGMTGSNGSRYEFPDPGIDPEWQDDYDSTNNIIPGLPVGLVGDKGSHAWAVSIIRVSIRSNKVQDQIVDPYNWLKGKWEKRRVRLPKIGVKQ